MAVTIHSSPTLLFSDDFDGGFGFIAAGLGFCVTLRAAGDHRLVRDEKTIDLFGDDDEVGEVFLSLLLSIADSSTP